MLKHAKVDIALRAGGRRLAAKTTVFIDFLVEIFAKTPQFVP